MTPTAVLDKFHRPTLLASIVGMSALCVALSALTIRNTRELELRIINEKEAIVARKISEAPRKSGALSANPHNTQPIENSDSSVKSALRQIKALLEFEGNSSKRLESNHQWPSTLLHIVEELSLAEILDLADQIDSRTDASTPIAKGKRLLYAIIAENNPQILLGREELASDLEIQTLLYSNLAFKDSIGAWAALKDSQVRERFWNSRDELEVAFLTEALLGDPARLIKLVKQTRSDKTQPHPFRVLASIRVGGEKVREIAALAKREPDERLRRELSAIALNSTALQHGALSLPRLLKDLKLPQQDVDFLIENHLSYLAESDPENSIALIAETGSPKAQGKNIPFAVSIWAESDINAAAQFLGKMGYSKIRDESISEFSQVVSEIDPAAAAEWAMQIEATNIRDSTIEKVTKIWKQQDPEAATDWLNRNPSN